MTVDTHAGGHYGGAKLAKMVKFRQSPAQKQCPSKKRKIRLYQKKKKVGFILLSFSRNEFWYMSQNDEKFHFSKNNSKFYQISKFFEIRLYQRKKK